MLFRSWIEAIVVVVLGGWDLLAAIWAPIAAPEAVRLLSPTVAHSVGLLVFGIVTALVTVNRRAALILVGVSAVGLVLLFTIGINLAPGGEHHTWGFTYASSGLHAVLMCTNLALLMWIGGEALEGRPWMPIRRSRARATGQSSGPPPSRTTAAETDEPAPTIRQRAHQ